MYPIILSFGPIIIRSYGLFLTIGYLLGTYILWKEGKKQGFNEEKLLDLSIVILIFGLFGARLYYAFLHWNEFSSEPARIFAIWEGGLAFYGALGLGALAIWYFAKKMKWPFLQIADILSFCVVLATILGKIGAFLAGADAGFPTKLPWGVHFAGLIGQRHPAQIYEALWFVLVGFILLKIRKKEPKRGTILLSFLVLTSFGKFFLDFLRENSKGVNLDQIVSILLVIGSSITLYYWLGKPDLGKTFRLLQDSARKFRQTEKLNSIKKGIINGYQFLQRKIRRNQKEY